MRKVYFFTEKVYSFLRTNKLEFDKNANSGSVGAFVRFPQSWFGDYRSLRFLCGYFGSRTFYLWGYIMFWIVLGLGFVATVIYVALSNKKGNKFTIIIALLMVASTLLLGLATNELEKMISPNSEILENNDSTDKSPANNSSVHTDNSSTHTDDESVDETTTSTTSTNNTSDKASSTRPDDKIEKLKAFEKEGKWGYIDNAGKTVIPFIYDYADEFYDGFAAVRIDYRWGFIDQNGKTVIPFDYSGAWSFIDGLAPVFKDNLWGFINQNNELIIDYQYSNISKMGGAYYDENDNKIIY